VPTSHEKSVFDSIIGEEEGEALWQLVHALPDAEQPILVLRHAYKLPYAEIAKRLRLSESACKRLHYRVLNKLKLLTQETDLWSKITKARSESKPETL
jgi:RNA polymerase sigma factor (sigma-70 family)